MFFFAGYGKDGYGLRLQALSLYEWLDMWLKGVDLWPKGNGFEEAASGEQQDV